MASESDNNRSTLIKAGIAVAVIFTLLLCLIVLALSRLGTTRDGGDRLTPPEVEVTPTLDPGVPLLTIDANDVDNWPSYIEHNFFFGVDYPPDWKVEELPEDSPEGSVKWIAPDTSEFVISYNINTTRSLSDYLRKLDFERSTELDGEPSVEVLSSTEFDVNGRQAIQRYEKQIEDDNTNIVVYMSVLDDSTTYRPINYIFTFTILPPDGIDPVQTQVYTNYLNVIGTFIFQPFRYDVRGEIVTGKEALVDWCLEGYYVRFSGGISGSSSQYIFLRGIGEVGYPPFNGAPYLNKQVNIQGVYQTDKELCFDLTCDCEDYLIVEDITLQNPSP